MEQVLKLVVEESLNRSREMGQLTNYNTVTSIPQGTK